MGLSELLFLFEGITSLVLAISVDIIPARKGGSWLIWLRVATKMVRVVQWEGYFGAEVNLVSRQLIAISCRGSAQWSTQLRGSFVYYSGQDSLLDALFRTSEMLAAPCWNWTSQISLHCSEETMACEASAFPDRGHSLSDYLLGNGMHPSNCLTQSDDRRFGGNLSSLRDWSSVTCAKLNREKTNRPIVTASIHRKSSRGRNCLPRDPPAALFG